MSPIMFVKIITTLMTLFLVSCASLNGSNYWSSYRNCPVTGEAYFKGIPLASRNEHAQAERFTPSDPANCLIYVVRSDHRGSKSAAAWVFLYEPGKEPPALPPDYWPWFGMNTLMYPRWSERYLNETPRELHKAKIHAREVYAMWELPPSSYVLDASLSMTQPFSRAVITCVAGHTTFWDVTSLTFFDEKARLHKITEAKGKSLVLGRLRSVGMQPGRPLSEGFISTRQCPAR